MEVVRSNFKDTLPLISESIEKADFFSIDAEFTGLSNGRDVTIFDLPEDYYIHTLNGSSEFLLIQFGLSAFYWDEKKKHYMNDTYNFYLFPRGPGHDRMFLCQSSSLDFLAANGFNFNKLIKEGITYMTASTETKLRESLTEKQKQQFNGKEKDTVRIPEENKQQIEDICNRVKNFIENTTDDEMEIDKCNSFIRLLLFQELARFKHEVMVDTKILENKNRVLKVTRIKPDMEDHDTIRKKREWDELEEAVGFSKVAQMISQSEKLVVGHNMLLDILHTLSHFFQQLPGDYASFKEFTHCMFPKLLDTKYMSSLPPFKDKLGSSVLTELLSTLAEHPFTIPTVGSLEGRGYAKFSDKQHEAGYDAYITGLCFLAMHAHLTRMRGEGSERLAPQSATLKPFLNKIFLAKTARQGSSYINLTGDDPSPSRDHVFHLVFPKEWQRSDINQLFSPFGGVLLHFFNDSSAYIGLERRDQASNLMRALAKDTRVTLTPYHRYKSHGSGDTEVALRSELAKSDTYKLIAKMDIKPRQATVLSKSNVGGSWTSPQPRQAQLPERVSRVRSNSTSTTPTTPPSATRKRTSSGVFQVDESEPLPKKSEISPSPPENPSPSAEARRTSAVNTRMPAEPSNGRKKIDTADTGKKDTINKKKVEKINEKVETRKEKVIETFDSKSKSNCVAAFKESDSWE